MKIGLSRRIITPADARTVVGVGTGRRADGTLDPLHVRVIAAEDAEGTRAAVVVCDLLYVGAALAGRIRAALAQAHGLAHAIVVATHTHSAPKTAAEFDDGNAVQDDFADTVAAQAEAAARDAFEALRPAMLSLAAGEGAPALNRRVPVPRWARISPRLNAARVLNQPNRAVPADRGVTACRVAYDDGSGFWIVNAALHPAVFRGNAYSADFPGYLLPALREATGAGADCEDVVYLQGWTGDQSPDLTVRRPVPLRPDAWVDYLVCRDTFNRAGGREALVGLAARLARALATAAPLAAAGDDAIRGARRSIALPMEGGGATTAVGMALRLGPLRMVAVNGEPFAAYRRALLRHAEDAGVMTLGYLDGPFGYLPDGEGLRLGGYEPDRSLPLFRQAARFDRSAEARFNDAARDLLRDIG
ncbi:MAG: hypothetical protein AB7G39_08395 [Alphaproteobacteria bacterium]